MLSIAVRISNVSEAHEHPGEFNEWRALGSFTDRVGKMGSCLQNQAMTELELPHEAIDYTLNPPPRNTKATDWH